jgi:hypothetical protein
MHGPKIGSVALILVGLVLLWFASWPFVIGMIDGEIARNGRADGYVPATPEPPDGPVEFGTGGAACNLTGATDAFGEQDRIHFVARLITRASAPTFASITLSQDDPPVALPGYPTTVTLNVGADCVSETLPRLMAGHYQMDVWIASGAACALCHSTELLSEFDVRP